MTKTRTADFPTTRTATIDGHVIRVTYLSSGKAAVLCETHPDVVITMRPMSLKLARVKMQEHVSGRPAPTEPKVDKDGVVTLDGKVLGRVEKTRKDTSIYAAIGGYEGPVRWFPLDVDGKRLCGHVETRKQAINIVREASRTEVTNVKRIDGWSGEYVECWLTVKGASFGLSRYPTETAWVVDSFTPCGAFMPHWANGSGTRCTSSRVVTDPAAVTMVNDAVKDHFGDDPWFATFAGMPQL